MAIVKEMNGFVSESKFPYYEEKFKRLQEKLLVINHSLYILHTNNERK